MFRVPIGMEAGGVREINGFVYADFREKEGVDTIVDATG